jgi:hypothetical protein
MQALVSFTILCGSELVMLTCFMVLKTYLACFYRAVFGWTPHNWTKILLRASKRVIECSFAQAIKGLLLRHSTKYVWPNDMCS